jgi:hypothetical protein
MFSREFSGLLKALHFREFITFYNLPKGQRCQIILCDVRKGTFPGSVSIPADDMCHKVDVLFHVCLGFKENVLISCRINGYIKSTLYDFERLNETRSVQIVLKNGRSVPLLLLEAQIEMSGDVFHVAMVHKLYYVFSYRKKNMYKHVKYLIKLMKKTNFFSFLYNSWHGLFFLLHLPSLEANVARQIYEPKEGLLKNGSGDMTFMEMTASFHPQTNDAEQTHFHFNPYDGSLLHLIRNPGKRIDTKEHLTSVDIYKLVD